MNRPRRDDMSGEEAELTTELDTFEMPEADVEATVSVLTRSEVVRLVRQSKKWRRQSRTVVCTYQGYSLDVETSGRPQGRGKLRIVADQLPLAEYRDCLMGGPIHRLLETVLESFRPFDEARRQEQEAEAAARQSAAELRLKTAADRLRQRFNL